MRRPNAHGRKPESESVYRTDLINGAIGAQRLTNQALAEKAGVAVATVSAIRNGEPRVGLTTLKAVLDALDLTLDQVFQPKPEATPAVSGQ